MPNPKYQMILLPLLRYCGDQQEHTMRECYEHLVKEFQLIDQDLQETIRNGQQSIFESRVYWARTFMKMAGLVETPGRGLIKITQCGLDALKQNPMQIDVNFLRQYPGFVEFEKRRSSRKGSEHAEKEVTDITPLESLEIGYQNLRDGLINEILERVKAISPAKFEKLVIELLVKMGYGGTLQDAGKAIGKSGDGGIDGIIKEDRLGLDVIYIQAKRWEGNVSRPEIQKFTGALQMHHARKGVFITTSDFTKEALEYVRLIDTKIVLISGDELAQYMIDFNLGVSTISVYEIKKIDSDYYSDEI